MSVDEKQLVMSFDPKTIQHLGIRMYSTLPPVLAELIANSYDADAENVTIKLVDENGEKQIIIEDDGTGMSFTELNTKFLRIGRNRRYEDGEDQTPNKGRKIIGKKGLGKLSFFGIAHTIEVITKKGGKENSFQMNWEEIKSSDEKEYNPKILTKDEKCPQKEHGTKIILKEIQRESEFKPEDLADNLSKIFIVDSDFNINIQYNSDNPIKVQNERKYSELDKEVEWKFPEDILMESEYEKRMQIKGHLMATEKPISPRTNMRGITLFSRKKLVNAPEYFSDSTSSHFFSYLTGWLQVDFIDELEDDVISTNRQSLNWNHPEMVKLREYLSKLMSWLERDWRKKREQMREKKLTEVTGININEWFGKLPNEVKKNVEPLVRAIVKDSELPMETNTSVIKNLHSIAPEYIYWHYRHLHDKIKESAETDYKKEDYYRAFLESAKKYINSVKSKSGSAQTSAYSMMGDVFGDGKSLSVTKKYKKPSGEEFDGDTKKDIEEGQKFLSMGMVSGGRNPPSHEEIKDLKESDLFNEKDCLDMLSILSHLFRRLEDAEKKQES